MKCIFCRFCWFFTLNIFLNNFFVLYMAVCVQVNIFLWFLLRVKTLLYVFLDYSHGYVLKICKAKKKTNRKHRAGSGSGEEAILCFWHFMHFKMNLCIIPVLDSIFSTYTYTHTCMHILFLIYLKTLKNSWNKLQLAAAALRNELQKQKKNIIIHCHEKQKKNQKWKYLLFKR